MKPISNLALVLLSFTLLFSSCNKLVGEGPVVMQERETGDFSGIVLKVPAKLTYSPGTDFSVKLEAQQNILDAIECRVDGNDLLIHFRENNTNLKNGEKININISSPALGKLELHGSGEIFTTGEFAPFSLKLLVSGSGEMNIHKVATGALDASISGSGKINFTGGAVASQFLEISGSGTMDMGNLVSQSATVHIAGSGNIKVHSEQLLDVNISGSGTVRYKGNPVVTSSVSGSGSVSRW